MKLIDNIEEFKKGYDSYIHNNIYNWFCLNNCSLNVLEYYVSSYNDIDWYSLSSYQPLPELFIDKYADKINWLELFNNDNVLLSDGIIENHIYQYNLYVAYYNIVEIFDIIGDKTYMVDKSFGNERYRIIFEELIKKYSEKYEIDKLSYEVSKSNK